MSKVRSTSNYKSPETLERFGPTLKATWSVPAAIQEALQSAGLPVPPPISGHVLVDTGATATCVALDVAEELGLQPIDIRPSYGVGGLHTNNVYAITLELPVQTQDGAIHSLAATIDAAGVPELGNHGQGLLHNGKQIRMTGLLGRDLMRFMKITYCGRTGRVDYEFDFSSLLPQRV